MQAVDKKWDELIRTCVKNGDGRSVRLWSFEVKITLLFRIFFNKN